jgi:hypothetical protein
LALINELEKNKGLEWLKELHKGKILSLCLSKKSFFKLLTGNMRILQVQSFLEELIIET